jgi:hypothetical protein
MTCQAIGCREYALPWLNVLPFGDVEVGVYLCRRHEREVVGFPSTEPRRPEPSAALVEEAQS